MTIPIMRSCSYPAEERGPARFRADAVRARRLARFQVLHEAEDAEAGIRRWFGIGLGDQILLYLCCMEPFERVRNPT